MFQPTNPQNAADIEAIKDMMLALSIGQTMTYDEITARLGYDARLRRWIINRAQRAAELDCGGLFTTVKGAGVMRLPSISFSDVGLHSLQRIQRHARRAHDRLASVKVNDLDQNEQNKLLAHRSMLGAISSISDGRRAKTIAKEVSTVGQAVPAGRVLELLRDKNIERETA